MPFSDANNRSRASWRTGHDPCRSEGHGSDSNEGAVALGLQRDAFSRTILEVLREADEPMGIRDIAAARMKHSGKDLAGHEFDLVVARVRNAVPRMNEYLDGEARARATYRTVKAAA